MKTPLILLLAVTPAAPAEAAPPAVSSTTVSLGEAMAAAELYSPQLRARGLERKAAHEDVGVAQSGYLPWVGAEAIDSWGFPGSSGYLGVGGLMGSPYRSGDAGGLVARETLLDFGRTYAAVDVARELERFQRQGLAVDRYLVDADVLQTYYECARYRSEHEAWDTIHGETELVASEVARYVNTGQRSIVDRYLSEAQVEEARTNRNYFLSRMASTEGRLALLMGRKAAEVACPALPALDVSVPLSPTRAENPYVSQARTQVDVAKSRLTAARTDYLPRILGVASVGGMARSRLVNRTDWSGGLGVAWPLFDGLGTQHRVARAKAELGARSERLSETELRMDELSARYNEVIEASKARIEHLENERKLAEEGFRVAKTRYFKFQGTLVDLRDALRNLGRIETEMKDTQADLLEASGAKALLNGAAPAARKG